MFSAILFIIVAFVVGKYWKIKKIRYILPLFPPTVLITQAVAWNNAYFDIIMTFLMFYVLIYILGLLIYKQYTIK